MIPEARPRKMLLKELQEVLDMEEKDLGMDLNLKKSSRIPITNRMLYKILKALYQEKGVQPAVFYTGNHIIERDEASKMIEEGEYEGIQDMELSLY